MKPIVHLNHSPKAIDFLRMYVGEDVYPLTLNIALDRLDLAVFRLTSRKEMRYYEADDRCPFVLLPLFGESNFSNALESMNRFVSYFERRRALA